MHQLEKKMRLDRRSKQHRGNLKWPLNQSDVIQLSQLYQQIWLFALSFSYSTVFRQRKPSRLLTRVPRNGIRQTKIRFLKKNIILFILICILWSSYSDFGAYALQDRYQQQVFSIITAFTFLWKSSRIFEVKSWIAFTSQDYKIIKPPRTTFTCFVVVLNYAERSFFPLSAKLSSTKRN